MSWIFNKLSWNKCCLKSFFPLAAHGNFSRIATKSWAHALNCATVVDAVPPFLGFLRSWEFASKFGPTRGFWKNLGNYAQNGYYIPLTQHWIASQTHRMRVKISVLTGNMFQLWWTLQARRNMNILAILLRLHWLYLMTVQLLRGVFLCKQCIGDTGERFSGWKKHCSSQGC